eukprot:4506559-Amphidinium_carterae.2
MLLQPAVGPRAQCLPYFKGSGTDAIIIFVLHTTRRPFRNCDAEAPPAAGLGRRPSYSGSATRSVVQESIGASPTFKDGLG